MRIIQGLRQGLCLLEHDQGTFEVAQLHESSTQAKEDRDNLLAGLLVLPLWEASEGGKSLIKTGDCLRVCRPCSAWEPASWKARAAVSHCAPHQAWWASRSLR